MKIRTTVVGGKTMVTRLVGYCEICFKFCGKGKYQHYHRIHPEFKFHKRRLSNGRIRYICNVCLFPASSYMQIIAHLIEEHGVRYAQPKYKVTFLMKISRFFSYLRSILG